MSRSLGLDEAVLGYLAAHNRQEHPAQIRCREETAALGAVSRTQISSEQGAMMAMFARLTRARRALEIGVFTGYSALTVALAMKAEFGAEAYLLACDISEEWTTRARAYWRAADVEDVIDLKVAPATETLDRRLAEGAAGSFDLAFIDADKTGYDAYYERTLALLRTGGVLLVDNMLWSGAVADPSKNDPDTLALRALAAKARDDARVRATLIAVGDGVLVCEKR